MKLLGSCRWVVLFLLLAGIPGARLRAVNPTLGSVNIKVTWVPSFRHGYVALFVTNNGSRPIKVSQWMDCSIRLQPGLQQQAMLAHAVMADDGSICPAAEFALLPGAGMNSGGGGQMPAPMEIAPGETKVLQLSCDDVGDAPENSSAVTFSLKRRGRVLNEITFVKDGNVWKEKSAADSAGDAATGQAPAANKSGGATKEHPWQNSLGMRFVPVQGTKALFSIWDTRVQDYGAFISEVTSGMKVYQEVIDESDNEWEKPDFEQSPTDPAVNVSWDEAKAFCGWLTVEERKAGVIGKEQSYRLPTDEEWSAAAGKSKYPWGNEYPPPKDAGNFFSQGTTPAGSYRANESGLYDMGGNVRQWCEDFYHNGMEAAAGLPVHDDEGGANFHMLRGSSFNQSGEGYLLSAARWPGDFGSNRDAGFRCVLDGAEKSAVIGKATKDHPWENSLGMKFAPVAGTQVLFGIWDTRVRDYEKFQVAMKGMLKNYEALLRQTELARDAFEEAQMEEGKEWPKPNFKQEPTHPAVMVSWFAARAFCDWLTQKERAAGLIARNQRYRLPTDREWSAAAGENVYSWGNQWSPPKGAGNYAVDNYGRTTPVGSFKPNESGLYDMGGNVWQWCANWYRKEMNSPGFLQNHHDMMDDQDDDGDGPRYRVMRGAAWDLIGDYLALAVRGRGAPEEGKRDCGFRCVLVTDEPLR